MLQSPITADLSPSFRSDSLTVHTCHDHPRSGCPKHDVFGIDGSRRRPGAPDDAPARGRAMSTNLIADYDVFPIGSARGMPTEFAAGEYLELEDSAIGLGGSVLVAIGTPGAPARFRVHTRRILGGSAGLARLIDGRYRVDRIAEAQAISHAILPEVSAQAGFCGVLVAVDDASGDTFSVSLWRDKSASEANVMSGWFRAQVAKFDQIYVAAPVRRDFSIKRHSSFGGALPSLP